MLELDYYFSYYEQFFFVFLCAFVILNQRQHLHTYLDRVVYKIPSLSFYFFLVIVLLLYNKEIYLT